MSLSNPMDFTRSILQNIPLCLLVYQIIYTPQWYCDTYAMRADFYFIYCDNAGKCHATRLAGKAFNATGCILPEKQITYVYLTCPRQKHIKPDEYRPCKLCHTERGDEENASD